MTEKLYYLTFIYIQNIIHLCLNKTENKVASLWAKGPE